MVDARYKACYMKEVAEMAGCELRTFKTWLTPSDQKEMIDLGWDPFTKLLKPPVVRYLREKFIDKEHNQLFNK